MSLYDTLSSFTTMLLGSVVTDNHSMTDQARVQFMASGKVVNLFASFAVARMGLAIFAGAHVDHAAVEVDNDTDADDEGYYNLTQFRIFLTLLAGFCGILFVVAQAMILGNGNNSGGGSGGVGSCLAILKITTRNLWRRSSDNNKRNDDYDVAATVAGTTAATDTGTGTSATPGTGGSTTASSSKKRKLHWRRVLQDFWRHDNFRAWIGMEMLLEAQNTFCITFLKTFVDQLILRDDDQKFEADGSDGGGGLSRDSCDWLLSMIGPMTQIVAIGTYIPIRKFGYPRVYSILFGVNIVLSLLLLTLANESSTYLIIAFLCIYPVLTGAVLSAGFHLAMSDMVMEMKRKHAMEGRYDEPSLAGLFMGANALACKPMESILPILTATVLNRGDESNQKQNLFYILVLPPLVCSCLQLLAWRRFDLTPKRTVKMRDELKKLDGDTSLLV
jgi:Na+/melibiose symporter-like transporter